MNKTTYDLYSEKEHADALAWWNSTGKTQALCDDCRSKMMKGEGYCVKGTVFLIGDTKLTDESGSLLCEKCYRWRCKQEDEQR